MLFGLFYKAITNIYEIPNETKIDDNTIVSAISDEGLHGMGVVITGPEVNAFLPIKTHYHYLGFVKKDDLLILSIDLLKKWEYSDLMVINETMADIISIPKVKGFRIVTLTKGSLIHVLDEDFKNTGWAKVRLSNGKTGYIFKHFLSQKKFSQAGLWEKQLPQKYSLNEIEFRKNVVLEATRYYGVQYRWGGKSPFGIDCSGLTSMSYMLHGILIYRDAKIMDGFPVKIISNEQMKLGDLLYFPGHIAMYIGNDKYIHATAKKDSGCVVINSLNPNDHDYRVDLACNLYAIGSIF